VCEFNRPRAGRETADAQIGTLGELIERRRSISAKERPAWSEYSTEWMATEERVTRRYPLYNKPDPHREQCRGTGTFITTSNPKSYCEAYTLGGCWTGILSPKLAPEYAPRNIKPCEVFASMGIALI
jgi:hypothetical protein